MKLKFDFGAIHAECVFQKIVNTDNPPINAQEYDIITYLEALATTDADDIFSHSDFIKNYPEQSLTFKKL